MVDRVESMAPADLRYILVKNVAQLAQYPVEKLPEGARAVVQDGAQGSPGFSAPSVGNQEWVFTRQPALTPLTFAYTSADGVSDTPSGNAILSKGGYIWVRWPQIFFVTLNGTTPVVIDNVVNQLSGGNAASSNIWAWFLRRTLGGPSGHVAVTAGTSVPTANQVSVVSDNAADNGNGLLCVYPLFRQF